LIKVVFFDVGETILRPFPSFQELFSVACREAGHDVSAEQVDAVRSALAPHLVDIAEETGVEAPSLSAEDSRVFWTYLYRRFLEELGIVDESAVGHLYSVFSATSSYKMFDDVAPTLERLTADGYRLGVISNFESWLEGMLVELEVGDVFEPSVISGIEGVEKPNPRLYEIAVEHAGIHPAEAVHVGDSPGLDVEPAQRVGLKAVLLDRTGRYPDAAWPTVRSLAELPDLLPRL
jgi:putative hydrolase of the HAD superfamily